MAEYKSPLQEAREAVAILQRYGIRPEDHHIHVGENGASCEFCGKPHEAKRHDPWRMGIGTDE